METVLEQQRRAHEAIERLENLAASLLLDVPRTYRDRLNLHHRVATLADTSVTTAASLLDLYDDADGQRVADLTRMSGDSALTDFYGRLRDVKDFHRRNPGLELEPMELEFMSPDAAAEQEARLDTMFTGEESAGRFLDLHAVFEMYLNLLDTADKEAPKPSYLKYLNEFHQLDLVPMAAKSADYKRYVTDLLQYLQSFIRRALPLYDIQSTESAHDADFAARWAARQLPATWTAFLTEDAHPDQFCAVCLKQFMKRAVYDRHLKEKRHRKAEAAAVAGAPRSDAEVAAARTAWETEWRDLARAESLVAYLTAHVMHDVVDATRENVECKQTLTESELAARALELETRDVRVGGGGDKSHEDGDSGDGGDDSDDEDADDDKIYNPLKLPMGWDGKPIPYWLWKLHGLGVEYPCEICGNYVYMGRKAFERHFQEWRHVQGMKALGIPNGKQMQEITKIQDAESLWAKIQAQKANVGFRAELDEEFEDEDGNVMSRKVYEDLLRQGLL
ncbi:hypothetical protein BC828DRAFT_379692 [Blastocladiella britannica]|nr:hypothetical protein BC828DRAFT_379692 [Blastocladiella britannica]